MGALAFPLEINVERRKAAGVNNTVAFSGGAEFESCQAPHARADAYLCIPSRQTHFRPTVVSCAPPPSPRTWVSSPVPKSLQGTEISQNLPKTLRGCVNLHAVQRTKTNRFPRPSRSLGACNFLGAQRTFGSIARRRKRGFSLGGSVDACGKCNIESVGNAWWRERALFIVVNIVYVSRNRRRTVSCLACVFVSVVHSFSTGPSLLC